MATVQIATREHHSALCALSRRNPFTEDFDSKHYSGPDRYEAGAILMAHVPVTLTSPLNTVVGAIEVVGLVSLRHRVRPPLYTSLYDIAVDEHFRNQGIGRQLMDYAMELSPRKIIRANVDGRNTDALEFYSALGYQSTGWGQWNDGQRYAVLVLVQNVEPAAAPRRNPHHNRRRK